MRLVRMLVLYVGFDKRSLGFLFPLFAALCVCVCARMCLYDVCGLCDLCVCFFVCVLAQRHDAEEELGIISPYQSQLKHIRNVLGTSLGLVEVNSVDKVRAHTQLQTHARVNKEK